MNANKKEIQQLKGMAGKHLPSSDQYKSQFYGPRVLLLGKRELAGGAQKGRNPEKKNFGWELDGQLPFPGHRVQTCLRLRGGKS